jgi:methylthioribose-1-phosphate isomerase
MKQELQSIWVDPSKPRVYIIDQRALPHRLVIETITSVEAMARAIREMHVRGAPLIGVAAAYGIYLACVRAERQKSSSASLTEACRLLAATRPTAVNLAWALERQQRAVAAAGDPAGRSAIALATARSLEAEEIDRCARIGRHGLGLITALRQRRRPASPVQILTHCNAGWLACVRHGTALAPVYAAWKQKISVHVWVDETRPRNQGARLTAWELARAGIPHTLITDNSGGHLMQHGRVDLVLVGSDRTTRRGDVANKIGTYLKALAAHDNGVPFYAALPASSIDWELSDGLAEIPIEERSAEEVRRVRGLAGRKVREVLIAPRESPASNYAFDITPARLVTGLITERGICPASEKGLQRLFPEKSPPADNISTRRHKN